MILFDLNQIKVIKIQVETKLKIKYMSVSETNLTPEPWQNLYCTFNIRSKVKEHHTNIQTSKYCFRFFI